MRKISPVAVIAVALAATSGCASSRAASREPATSQPVVLAAAEPAPAPVVAPAPQRPALPVKKVARPARPAQPAQVTPLLASTTLKTFMAVRGAQMKRRGATMPDDVERTWHTLFQDVETIVTEEVPPGRESELLGTLMRLRMSIDAEHDMDLRRYRKVPEDLQPRVKDTLAALDEQVQVLRALATPSGFALTDGADADAVVTLRHPVHIVNVTSYFGHRRDPILRATTRFHAGVDFGGPQGALVMSAGPGVVAMADWQGAGGNHVIVVHPNGLRTHYSHLSRILVRQGMHVEAGTPVGLMGDTGRATGPHLHFAVSRNGAFLDPLDVMDIPMNREGVAGSDS